MSLIHKVLYDFDAEEEGEMTVRAGDIVKLLPQSEGPDGGDDEDEDRNGWSFVKATRTGERGYVPTDYIEPTQSPVPPKLGVSSGSNLENKSSVKKSPTQPIVEHSSPSPYNFTPQNHNQTPTHQTPEVGKRLSMAALVNPPPPETEPPTQTENKSNNIPDPLMNETTPIDITPLPPPPPTVLEDSKSDQPKQYGLDKKPFGMDIVETAFPSPGKRTKGPGSSIASFPKSPGASRNGSAVKSKSGGLSKFKKSANMVQNMVRVSSAVAAPRVPSLASAVEREDWNELTKRNDEYFSRLVSSQAETFDSLTDMVDALSKKLNEATKSSHDLVSKLSELDELIDEEKRKWKSQYDAEKNAEVLGRSKQLISSSSKDDGGYSNSRRSDPYSQ